MGVLINLEIQGLDEARQLLVDLQAMGARRNAIELTGRVREEPEAQKRLLTNAQVLEYQKIQGRDVISRDGAEIAQIGERMAAEYRQQIEDRLRRQKAFITKTEKFAAGKIKKEPRPLSPDSRWVNQVAGKMLRAGMSQYMDQAHNRLLTQTSSTGSYNRTLSEGYRAWKKRQFGFEYPTLKATGQLTDALNPSGPGSRNMRFSGGLKDWRPTDFRAAMDFANKFLR